MRTATATCAASTEPWPSTGNSFSTTFSLGSDLHQLEHVGHRAFAVAAIVVEEFDEGDVAVLVAEHDAARRVENRLCVRGDARFMFLGLGGGLALAQFGHGLFQHLGMREQIILDDGLDIAALGVGKTLCRAAGGMPQSASANSAGASRRNEGIGKSSW